MAWQPTSTSSLPSTQTQHLHRQRCASSKALLGIPEESKAKLPQSVGSEARAAAAADRRNQRGETAKVQGRAERRERAQKKEGQSQGASRIRIPRIDYNSIDYGQGAGNFFGFVAFVLEYDFDFSFRRHFFGHHRSVTAADDVQRPQLRRDPRLGPVAWAIPR